MQGKDAYGAYPKALAPEGRLQGTGLHAAEGEKYYPGEANYLFFFTYFMAGLNERKGHQENQ